MTFAKLTRPKMMLLGLSAGLMPCLAVAVNMPDNSLTEQVDTTHLGEIREGVTPRTQKGWTVQVGAFADRDSADALLRRLQAERPSELGHALPLVTALAWDDSRMLYRARFAGLSLDAASSLCAGLNRAGQACFLSQGGDEAGTPAPREAATSPLRDDMRGTGLLKEAPASLSVSAIALAAVAIPALSPIVDGYRASKAPKLVALNDKLRHDAPGRVSNDDLSGMRGGFFTSAGAQFDFGASVKTLVNGQLALQTNLTWTPSGPNISSLTGLGQQIASQVQANLANVGNTGNASHLAASTPSNNVSANATPASTPASTAGNLAGSAADIASNAAASALNAAASAVGKGAATPAVSTTITPTPAVTTTPTPQTTITPQTVAAPQTTVAPQTVTAPQTAAAPQTTTLTIPTNVVTGVTVPGAGGSTQVLTNIGANQIQNIILNSASNQTINQNTNVTLTIYNLPQWQQQLAEHAISAQLAGELMAVSGLGH